jgi:uncharacterized membrane protein
MNKKIISASLALIFVISMASATTISQEDIVIDLETNSVTLDMEIEELTTESFNWRATHEIRNLKAYFNEEEVDCRVEKLAVGSTVNCETDLKENFSVRLEYETDELVSSRENVQTFSYSQSIYRPIKNYSLRVLLPEGSGLVDQSNITTPVTQPAGAEVGNMDGRRFSVEWNTSPELGDTPRFQIIFEEFEERPNRSFSIPFKLIGLILILLIVLGVYWRKREVEASSVLEEISSDGEMVLEMLRENNGEMLQKDIVDESDYSKAKISGVVNELEDMDVISKEKEGRSNKVVLKKKYLS